MIFNMAQYTIITGTFNIPSNAQVGNYTFSVDGGNTIYSKQNAVWINNLNIVSIDPTVWDLSVDNPAELYLDIYGENAFITSISASVTLRHENYTINPKYQESSITPTRINNVFEVPDTMPPSGLYNVIVTQRMQCIRTEEREEIVETITFENALEIIIPDDSE